MASFRLPKIGGESVSSTPERPVSDKQRRISTGSMRTSLPTSPMEPSPPSALSVASTSSSSTSKGLSARRRKLGRSMSVPGLALGSSLGQGQGQGRCPTLVHLDGKAKQRGAVIPSAVVRVSEQQQALIETKRQGMRVHVERESRAVSARVSDFCSRAAAASTTERGDETLVDTVDCMEDADIAAERLFLNNMVPKRQVQRRHGFTMPSLAQGPHPGAMVHQHHQASSDEAPVHQRLQLPVDSQSSGYGGSASANLEPPGRGLGEEESASGMVERISRWLEDVERLKRDPSEDLSAGISLVALT